MSKKGSQGLIRQRKNNVRPPLFPRIGQTLTSSMHALDSFGHQGRDTRILVQFTLLNMDIYARNSLATGKNCTADHKYRRLENCVLPVLTLRGPNSSSGKPHIIRRLQKFRLLTLGCMYVRMQVVGYSCYKEGLFDFSWEVRQADPQFIALYY